MSSDDQNIVIKSDNALTIDGIPIVIVDKNVEIWLIQIVHEQSIIIAHINRHDSNENETSEWISFLNKFKSI